MPVSDRMILLVRGLAVCGTEALLGLIASLVAGQALGLTVGWLVPMTAVSALALAAATLVPLRQRRRRDGPRRLGGGRPRSARGLRDLGNAVDDDLAMHLPVYGTRR